MTRERRAFYSGENIDLLVPTAEDVEESTWADWFNSQRTARYTHHALFPNTREAQRDFYATLQQPSRLSLLIATKKDRRIVGTVSLSGIDFRRRSAAIAIVMDTENENGIPALASLEAMALLTQHAFEVLGLERVEAGQVFPALARWNQLLELLGYRSEGFLRNAFVRGHDVSDEVKLACLYTNYIGIRDDRSGSLWPGNRQAFAAIKALPKKSFAEMLDEATRALEAEYFGSPIQL